MTDGPITRDDLRTELDREFREQRKENGRWHPRRLFTPDSLARFFVYAGTLIFAASVVWVNTQRDIADNTAAIQRTQVAQVESTKRLSEQISSERTERIEQIRQSEGRLSDKIDDVLMEVKEQRGDIKELIRSLPRPD